MIAPPVIEAIGVGIIQNNVFSHDALPPDQLLGAIIYFGISQPTLTGIFGAKAFSDIDQAFPIQLERLIDAVIAVGPRSKA